MSSERLTLDLTLDLNRDLSERLRAVCEADAVVNGVPELEAGLLVNEYIDPKLCVGEVRQQIKALSDNTEASDVPALLQYFRDTGFATSLSGGVDQRYSALNWVLEHHRGLPIVMALLLITVARRRGMTALGVNQPGHFLVSIDGVLVDPLGLKTMESVSVSGPSVGAREIALRMFNNLKGLALERRDFARALDILDIQYAISDTAQQAQLLFERGEVWEGMGMVDAARDAWQSCEALSKDSRLRSAAAERIDMLGRATSTRH